jgi:hypothetical protein
MGRKLTLESIHRGCSESSLLGIIRNQLCHPSVTVPDNISHSFHHVKLRCQNGLTPWSTEQHFPQSRTRYKAVLGVRKDQKQELQPVRRR